MDEIKPITRPRIYIEVIESMRGMAALGVVFFHFVNSTLPTIKPNPLSGYFEWAHLGIPVFFIISGFIIPYAMYTAGYTIKNAGRFFLKRMVRMVPPAWAAILLMFGVYYGAILLSGTPIAGRDWPGLSAEAILGNLFFSFQLLGVGKYIDLFWTLEVEFQFYVLITFLLPVILKYAKQPVILTTIFLVINLTHFIFTDQFMFFRDNVFFILGILLFLYKMNLVTRNYFIYASIFFTFSCYVQQGIYGSTASIIAILFIAFVKFNNPVTHFLGMISYSLYITHHMSGVVAEFVLRNLTGMHLSDPLKGFMLFVYVGCSIFCAWIFFKIVEEPSLRLSKKIYLNKKNEKIVTAIPPEK